MERATLNTLRLWLEPDAGMPKLKRLRYEQTKAPLRDILLLGIHPLSSGPSDSSFVKKMVESQNESINKPPELVAAGYANDFASGVGGSLGSHTEGLLQETLRQFNEGIWYVESLTYAELLAVANERLTRRWVLHTLRNLLNRIHPRFEDLRAWLKSKHPKMKLQGYDDLKNYDLPSLFSLEDFRGQDQALIAEALPGACFRLETALSGFSDHQGRLRIQSRIGEFQLTANTPAWKYAPTIWWGKVEGEAVRLYPSLDDNPARRADARRLAEKWRLDEGRYVFSTNVDRLERMIPEDLLKITFPALIYGRSMVVGPFSGKVIHSRVRRFALDSYPTSRLSGNDLRAILRRHEVPMTGKKDELLAKMASLAARLYRSRKAELDRVFQGKRFVRMRDGRGNTTRFPGAPEGPMEHLLLAMYCMKHLRGNAVLESNYETDAFTLEQLAQSLIKCEVHVQGVFLAVEQ